MIHAGLRLPALLALATTLLAFTVFFAALDYPWQLAVLAATAIGALVYSTQITWLRMRRLYRPPSAGDLAIGRGSAHLAPGEENQGQREQQVQASAQDKAGHEQDQPARQHDTGEE